MSTMIHVILTLPAVVWLVVQLVLWKAKRDIEKRWKQEHSKTEHRLSRKVRGFLADAPNRCECMGNVLWRCSRDAGHEGACAAWPVCTECQEVISYDEHTRFHHLCDECWQAGMYREQTA